MGRYVNGKWREDLPDLTGNGGSQSNSDPISAPAPRPSSSSSAPAPSAPAPTGYDTNSYEGRQALRDQGYFIDNSGIYAPGAGDRVGDTFSGAQAGQNVAPSPTRLPILNGHPVSPSNGVTGPQTPYIMYRGDPLYNQYFGPGTPGYSSTSRAANALGTDLPSGQATYEGTYGRAQVTPRVPQPAQTNAPLVQNAESAPAPTALVNPNPQATDDPYANSASTHIPQTLPYEAAFQQPSEGGAGYGPYATPQPPSLMPHGRYVEGGKVIEKSTDQYGNKYFQTVGTSNGTDTGQPPAPTTNAPQQPLQPQQPVAATNPTTGQPATPAQPTGGISHTVVGEDGKPYQVTMTEQDWSEYQQDKAAQAQAEQDARKFDQGIARDKVDIDRAVAEWNKTYQASLLQFQDRQLAQQTAYQAMQADLQKQALELQRQQQGQTISLEREKLDLARQQSRGNRRRLPMVRYR